MLDTNPTAAHHIHFAACRWPVRKTCEDTVWAALQQRWRSSIYQRFLFCPQHRKVLLFGRDRSSTFWRIRNLNNFCSSKIIYKLESSFLGPNEYRRSRKTLLLFDDPGCFEFVFFAWKHHYFNVILLPKFQIIQIWKSRFDLDVASLCKLPCHIHECSSWPQSVTTQKTRISGPYGLSQVIGCTHRQPLHPVWGHRPLEGNYQSSAFNFENLVAQHDPTY